MNIKKNTQAFLRYLGNYFLAGALRILCNTLTINISNSEVIDTLKKNNKNFILVFWHGHMLIPWYVHRNRNVSALVSKSKDGELLCRVLNKWGYNTTRGSSSKGGSEALRQMVSQALKGMTLAVTPDGPRGPECVFKPGAIITAQRAQIPIIFVATGYGKKWTLRSWDKFCIPKFFSKIKLIYSDPVFIDKDFSRQKITSLLIEYQNKLNSMQTDVNSEF